jgi:tetratricopeptide (TPR) repeat protein
MSNITKNFNDALAALNNKDLKRAEELFKRVIKIDKSNVPALNLLVVVLMNMERFAEAEPFIAMATSLNQKSDVSFYNYGLISKRLNKPQQALNNFSKALSLNSNVAETWNNRGTVFNDLEKYDLAIADFDKAISLNGAYGDAYANKGKSLARLKRYDEAFAAYDKALSFKPDLAEAWLGRGNVFWSLKRSDEAFAAYDKALSITPDLAEAWLGRGNVFYDLRRYDEAFAAYDKASSITSDLAEVWLGRGNVFWSLKRSDEAKFRNQAVAILMVELYELHDQNRFELFGFDNGWDDGSEIRGRINKAFKTIVDIRHLDDLQATATIKQKQIDILINLNGYMGEHRTRVFSYRPSPLQVSYLGFPATMWAEYIDYIIADPCVIPPEQEDCYVEKIVYLPENYLAVNTKRLIADRQPTAVRRCCPNGLSFAASTALTR